MEITLEKERRGPSLEAVTHFLVADRWIGLVDILTKRQLEQGAPSLAE